MRSLTANGQTRLLHWQHVRAFAVPASMIETATARRLTGDWAGACAAAHADVDLDLHAAAATHGREVTARIRADLRRLAPDLLRWHLPRTAADGLLRPGLTISLARYATGQHDVHLVVRTAPSWAQAGQRLSLALWDPADPEAGPHPRPRPDRRFRLDLHPHLWAADRAPELRERCGAALFPPGFGDPTDDPAPSAPGRPRIDTGPSPTGPGDSTRAAEHGHAAHRWAAEAAILRAADGYDGPVVVRLGSGRRLVLAADATEVRTVRTRGGTAGAVLPYAATWLPPDLELLHAGMIEAGRLHPLVAAALVPGSTAARPGPPTAGDGPRLVACRGATHRLGFAAGRLVPLDHEPGELLREELLVALGGPPLPCLRAIHTAATAPACLDEVRQRLEHGDESGAVALVTELLGPETPPEGALREAFTAATEGLIEHRLYRAGLAARIPAGVTTSASTRTDRTGWSSWRGRRHRRPRWRAIPD